MSCGDPAIEEAPLNQPRFIRENHAAYKIWMLAILLDCA
jgi:hypothetical protein